MTCVKKASRRLDVGVVHLADVAPSGVALVIGVFTYLTEPAMKSYGG